MPYYNVEQAQKEYASEMKEHTENSVAFCEKQQAALFAKILIKQTIYSKEHLVFCEDNELFVSKTPTGYDVVGFYIDHTGIKNPFSITVCKINELWYPSKRYVAADTKSCSGSILLWILLSLGCTLMGILMYYLMSAAIGI